MATKKKSATKEAAKPKAVKKAAKPNTFLTAFNKWNHSKFGEKPATPKKYSNPKFTTFVDYYDHNSDDALRVIEVDTLDVVAQWKDIVHDTLLFRDISQDRPNFEVYNSFVGFRIKNGNHYVVTHEDWEGSSKEIVLKVIN